MLGWGVQCGDDTIKLGGAVGRDDDDETEMTWA